VKGQGVGNGAGVWGVGGNVNSHGVHGQGFGTGCGVYGTAGTTGQGGVRGDGNSVGYGVIAMGGTAAGAAFWLVPQAADPGAPVEGNMWIENHLLHIYLNGAIYTVDVTAHP
jgi:hypothetical protein